MPSNIIDGQARFALVEETALSVPGSTGLGGGTKDVAAYARFAGIFSIVGSLTFQYQMGVNSGVYQVNSSFVVNSGGSTFDVLNYGHSAQFTISAANSQDEAVVLVYGEPIR